MTGSISAADRKPAKLTPRSIMSGHDGFTQAGRALRLKRASPSGSVPPSPRPSPPSLPAGRPGEEGERYLAAAGAAAGGRGSSTRFFTAGIERRYAQMAFRSSSVASA
jgi:hypothetical protein